MIQRQNKSLFVFQLLMYLFTANTFAERMDTVYFSQNKIKEIKVFEDDKLIQATSFKKNGNIAYKWNINDRKIDSYDAISYEDTLIQYFKINCIEYTIYQHFGNGPLLYIENYKDQVRHGDFERYSTEGELTVEGQYDTWEKVGVWTYHDGEGKVDRHIHWFHHKANSHKLRDVCY